MQGLVGMHIKQQSANRSKYSVDPGRARQGFSNLLNVIMGLKGQNKVWVFINTVLSLRIKQQQCV